MADWSDRTAGVLRRWASARHCNRVRGMARKTDDLQPKAVRDCVHRVWRNRRSAIRISEVDERRRSNPAVFSAICLLRD